jgi:hypothetical protein
MRTATSCCLGAGDGPASPDTATISISTPGYFYCGDGHNLLNLVKSEVGGMPMGFRSMMVIMLAVTTVGCSQYGASGPNDLGLFQRFDPPTSLPISLNVPPSSAEGQRNQELSKWIIRSDYLCNNYQLRLSRAIRDSRLATDALATVLSGLATILAPVQTKTALSGAATMVLGVGGDIQTDVFSEQASDVVSSAIQTVRTRARAALQKKMQASYANYTLEQGLVDVQRYDQETCTLNVGLNELRSSLITGPDGKRPNEPILPLPPTQLAEPPVVPPAPPAPPPHRAPPGGEGGAPVAKKASAALTAAVKRITSLVPELKQQAIVFGNCGLPQGDTAGTTLTDTAKAAVAKCLNNIPAPPSTTQDPDQVSLSVALTKHIPPGTAPTPEAKQLIKTCLNKLKLPEDLIIPDLTTGTLSAPQRQNAKDLATCLNAS